MRKLTITVPGHLHTGNMDLTGDLGRLYGTAGFTLAHPRTVVDFEPSDELTVSGVDSENAEKYAEEMMEAFELESGLRINVREQIPKHLGMGSQTALALAIGSAFVEYYSLDLSLEEIALTLGRSTIVALGLNSFRTGGFIVDGGYRTENLGEMIPPCLFQYPIPEDWLFVVCIPEKPIPKILEIKAKEDDEFLANLDRMPAEMSDRLSRIMLMKVMPSIMEHDIKSFGEAITAFNSRLGSFWEGFQEGNTYCHPSVEAAINLMLEGGAYGACQTCWGPTCYGLVDSRSKAEELKKKLEELMENVGGGEVFYSPGNNSGASFIEW